MNFQKDNFDSQNQFLCFSLGSDQYAVSLFKVKEVLAHVKLNSEAQAKDDYKGMIDLRGQIIHLFDLRIKFKIYGAEIPSVEEAPVIIIEPIYENQPLVGIYVDGIDHVVTYKKSEMSQPLFVSSLVNSEYIEGVGRIDHDLKIILDLQKIFSCDGLELIKEAS